MNTLKLITALLINMIKLVNSRFKLMADAYEAAWEIATGLATGKEKKWMLKAMIFIVIGMILQLVLSNMMNTCVEMIRWINKYFRLQEWISIAEYLTLYISLHCRAMAQITGQYINMTGGVLMVTVFSTAIVVQEALKITGNAMLTFVWKKTISLRWLQDPFAHPVGIYW